MIEEVKYKKYQNLMEIFVFYTGCSTNRAKPKLGKKPSWLFDRVGLASLLRYQSDKHKQTPLLFHISQTVNNLIKL